ncbi:WD40 repeat-like protein [Gyrodon lividus]|nr:WD40 repeat-like protein [Gyrodon lividus]
MDNIDQDTWMGTPRYPPTSARSTSTSQRTLRNFGTGINPRRRRALCSLLDVLAELKQDNQVQADFSYPSTSEEYSPPSTDEKLQNAGAELFYKFERRVENLDKELRDFANSSRQLGSSVGIVSSASKLQERLAKILFLFRENAAYLFPRKITRNTQEVPLNPNFMERRPGWRRRPSAPLLQGPLDPEMLPAQLENFARDVGAFSNCLNEFQEFTDEAISQSMRAFESDLNYWATCLYGYKNQFRSPAVQRYTHDLTTEIGSHIDNITVALSIFMEIGIPTIWFHQQHAIKNLLNVSTLSIFFGLVDATLLQYSYTTTGNILSDSVNIFWLSSLVFSIASGVNGLLGLTWKQSIYRSPLHRVPWWVLVWMKGSPLVFLVIAVACFSAGVVLFTYSSGQSPVTSTIIVVLTGVALLGLISISGWFALERWTFSRHKDQKWLEELIAEALNDLADLGVVRAHRIAIQWCSRRITITRGYFNRLFGWVSETRKLKVVLPFTGARFPSVDAVSTENPGSSDGHKNEAASLDVAYPRRRFQNAVRAVIKLQSARTPTRPGLPRRDSWWQTPLAAKPETSASPIPEPGFSALRGARMTAAIEQLKALQISQELTPHQALVRHVQFSPNGKYLATSSWDRTAVIFRVGERPTSHRTLVHVRGFVSQVAWSPNGRALLTRFTRGIKMWSEDGVCKQTIDRGKTVNSVVWLPSGQGFLSVEGSDVVKLDPHGRVLDSYNLGHIRLSNVAVTSDCLRLIGIGPSIPPTAGPQPTYHTRVEKRIIVYNMQTKRKESQTPLFDDVRDIVMAKRTFVVLVSFEQAAPQLWKLETLKDRGKGNGESSSTSRLDLKHTFVLNVPTSIAGSCYFGGRDEQFVFCVGKMGEVHIWDRDTAALLRYLPPPNIPELRDLMCISWNNATDDPMMFATGSHDGTVLGGVVKDQMHGDQGCLC